VPKEYLKRDYPEYANPGYLINPQPNPIPSTTRLFFTWIYYSLPALCVAFLLTAIFSDERNIENSERIFFLLSALMLPAIWCSIETYFSDIKKRQAMRLLDTVPREHLIGIVISFLKQHPEKLNEPSINLIIEDLHQAFPSA
jgi:hypothetical protein